MKKNALQKLRKAGTIFLVCTLVVGLLSGSFGVVLAMARRGAGGRVEGRREPA